MKLLLKNEEEREKVKKKEQLEEEILKHMKERDGQGDDRGRRSPPYGHGGYRGRRFGGADIHREPYGLDPPEPNPMLILGGLVDALRMAGLRANPRRV